MSKCIRILLLGACVLLAAAPYVYAATPSTMSYQGVLTDGGGNLVPNGNYNLTFRIWDAPVAGVLRWSENFPAVAVDKGGFSVVLGSTDDLNIAFASGLYLGVQVGANPELTPRIALTSTPGAMAVAMRGVGSGITGELNYYPFGPGTGDGGGYLHLLDDTNTGIYRHSLEPDFDGDGAWTFFKGAGAGYMVWDGNAGGGGQLVLTGPGSTTRFWTNASGNNAAVLPTDAISSGEVLDEPGIAQQHTFGGPNVVSTSAAALTDLQSVTITTPAAGYIVLEADTQFGLNSGAQVGYQIGDVAGGPQDVSHYFFTGTPSSPWQDWRTSSIRRTYFKAAGSYTFYFQAWLSAGPANSAYCWNPTFTAQYFPTSYGAVNTIANASNASTFERATPVTASVPSQQGVASGESVYSVDLRELELRVRREEAQLQEARLQLQQAQMKRQQDASTNLRGAQRGGTTPAGSPKEER